VRLRPAIGHESSRPESVGLEVQPFRVASLGAESQAFVVQLRSQTALWLGDRGGMRCWRTPIA
jgi:hypothetical protein